MKRLTTLLLALLMALSVAACGNVDPDKQARQELANSIRVQSVKTFDYYKVQDGLKAEDDLSALSVQFKNDWGYTVSTNVLVVGYAKAMGVMADYNAYYKKMEDKFKETYTSEEVLAAAYASAINPLSLALKNMDRDPINFAGFDLIKSHTYNMPNASVAGSYAWADMLILMADVTLPTDALNTKESLIAKYAATQNKAGGWAYGDSYDAKADVDTIAMVIEGLMPYYNTDTLYDGNPLGAIEGEKVKKVTVKEICDKAFDAMMTCQNEDGTFNSFYGNISSNSTALALRAAASFKVDLLKDERFIKNGKNLVEVVLSFQNEDGGFRAMKEEGKSDSFATNDCIKALTAAHKVLNVK